MRNPAMSLGAVPAFLFAAAISTAALAQTAPPIGHCEFVRHLSGPHHNPTPVEAVVWRDFVTAGQAATWIRLEFQRWHLDRGSYLRIVSVADGDHQTMHAHHVEQWSSTSAYFNGDTVMLELVAGPRSKNCAGGVTLVVGNAASYATGAATTSTPTWPCGSGGKDLWFKYTTNCPATVTFHTCSTGTNLDTTLQVFRGSCSALTSLGCNDDWSGCSSTVRSRLAVATTGATTL